MSDELMESHEKLAHLVTEILSPAIVSLAKRVTDIEARMERAVMVETSEERMRRVYPERYA